MCAVVIGKKVTKRQKDDFLCSQSFFARRIRIRVPGQTPQIGLLVRDSGSGSWGKSHDGPRALVADPETATRGRDVLVPRD